MTNLKIETPRLLLREFSPGDLDQVNEYASDPEVLKYVLWGPHSREETLAFIGRTADARKVDPRADFDLAVVLKDGERLIGGCGISVSSFESRRAGIGYVLNRRFWGQGFATEAAEAVLGFGFDSLKMHRIFATCDAENRRSARVLEKIGMRYEGRLRDECRKKGAWRDTFMFAILEQEWGKRRARE